ncbi:MAG: hypothetical protein WDO17_15510 [Alphaproteobacteria bacterium]
MAFRLRQDAEKWFAEIEGRAPLRTKFDLFYFCLMAGLMAGRRSEPTHAGRTAPEIVNSFVEDYRGVQRLIVGLLITAELKRLGIDLHEKESVRQTIRTLVDPHTQTDLTDEGMRLINAYASGGYDYIAEQRESKPYAVEEFLRDFVGLVAQAAEANPTWALPPTG